MIVVMTQKNKYVPNPESNKPFKNHGWRVKGVRPISRQLSERDPSLGLRVGNKLCVLCRKCVNTSMLFQQRSSISLTVLLPGTRTGRISSIFFIIRKIFRYIVLVVILFYYIP